MAMSVQELQDLFEGTDDSSDNDDSNDEDYRSDDDQPQGRERPRRRVNESDEEKEEEGKVEPDTAHHSDRPDDAEEGGYVPTDGRNYREPRPPFSGMLWNGRRNAFVRIDQENRRRPGGTRPQGYIWVDSILGYRRTRLQTDADEERLNEQERNNQRPRGTRSNILFGKEIPNAFHFSKSLGKRFVCFVFTHAHSARWHLNQR